MKNQNITIVVSTNRKNNLTQIVANAYQAAFKTQGFESEIFSLEQLPNHFIESVLYKKSEDKPADFQVIQNLISDTKKFVFIIPEYNGSFPGILKLFVDGLQFPNSFKGKKAALVGISSGTQGAAMAMSHFADILNYVGVHTLALRPRLINIEKNITEKSLTNAEYLSFIDLQAKQLTEF